MSGAVNWPRSSPCYRLQIRLREIQTAIISDNNIFANVNSVSLSTIDRVLARNQIRMKQLDRMPFERNSERVKQLPYNYVEANH